MKTGKYTLREFLCDHNLEQVIVPEIQRDYVWREDNVQRLLTSIKESADRAPSEVSMDEIANLSPAIREKLLTSLKAEQSRHNHSIGFLYAYYDPEIPSRYALIDGQQRMTTLYLLLLYLCVKEQKQEHFRREYFPEGVPKFDYKVREATHDFLVHFISFILDGHSMDDLAGQYWFFADYRRDQTITSIIRNYRAIDDFFKRNSIPLDYLENNIEFWYFDTKESQQGEELYIYMNSRGEPISPNESLKANLLKGLTDSEKHIWGERWELMQSFFWRHSMENGADQGMEAFLKWLCMMDIIPGKEGTPIGSLEVEIRKIIQWKRFGDDILGIGLEKIYSYFNALDRVASLGLLTDFQQSKWLRGELDGVDYIKLLPILIYAHNYPECKQQEVYRFSRFFINATRFDVVAKDPYRNLIYAVRLAEQFVDANYTDVADLVAFQSIPEYSNFLTPEEIIKLSIYKEPPGTLNRIDLEKAFWGAEDDRFLNGRVELLWKCMGFEGREQVESFDLNLFNRYLESYRRLWCVPPDDLLRRALLTKGNFSRYDGQTPSLYGSRYSFAYTQDDWQKLFLYPKASGFIQDLMVEFFIVQYSTDGDLSRENILDTIIKEWINTTESRDWRYHFVREPRILEYSTKKFVCFCNDRIDGIFLLREKIAYILNYEQLGKFI